MKILVVGSKWHDNILSVISFGFSELGHQPEIFDDNLKDKTLLVSKVLGRLSFKKSAHKFFDDYRLKIGEKLIEKIKDYKPDLVFVVNGIKLPPETIKKIRENFKVPVAAYIIDDPLLGQTWIYDLSAYSHLFVIDKSWMGYLEFFNPGRVFYLPQVADYKVFRPLDIEKDYDIGFGGTLSLRLPNAPSGFLRAQILNFLAEKKFKIIAFAPGIKEMFKYFPALKTIDYFDGYKNHEELNLLYNRSKIVLSIHSPQFKTGISPRVFEAAFAKSFQLVEYKSEIEDLFPEGIATFKSNPDLFDKVNFYLHNDQKRKELAENVYTFSLKNHTFKSRGKIILEIIKKYE